MTGADDDLLHLEGGELPLAAAGPPVPVEPRPAYAELLARLADGPERHALVTALDELRQATDRARDAQQRQERARARARRRALFAAGALALLLAAGGALGLRALDGRLQRLADEEARRDRQAGAAADEALERLRAEQTASLAALAGRLDGQQAALESRLAGVEAERDAAQAALDLAQARSQELQARADEAARRETEALAEARRERDLRLESLGDGARLRQQLLEKEQDLEALAHTLAELQVARVPVPPPAIVPSAAAAAGLAARVTSALRASGVPDESVVEASGPLDGALQDVLLLSAGREGAPARVRRARRVELAVAAGRPVLRLLDVRDASGQPLPDELVAVPALDRPAWERLGLALPGGAVSLERLRTGLDGLLRPHGWEAVALEGYADGALLGLRLEQRDGEGRLLRGLRAARGQVLPGPLLELRDGTLSVGTDERRFWEDVYRLSLPAGDLAAWQAALREAAP